ncbi:protocadherin alpha-7-like isoform X42 [Ctenopharyngodon idella]|uniref:protocadherin alpha-7-like isoform X42 n=1 Tax=Ctenopharyngodon idella TaxID=7959 RepID=UPI0022315B24|nr:protocadherin alpha-7-like isoform X42 [Ctenopharyngodon idella]
MEETLLPEHKHSLIKRSLSYSYHMTHSSVGQLSTSHSINSSVHMEESSVMQGAQGVLVQNWPTVSSAPDNEGGEVSPPVGAGVDSNSWHFRYGPGPGGPPHLKPGEVPPEAFIIPGSPAIISIRQGQDGDDKSDFITFGKKEEKKKKKKKKEKKDKREKGKDDDD